MRIALISDIHANAVALDAALAAITPFAPDHTICLGDVSSGPQQREVLARLRALGCPIVRGNVDDEVLHPAAAAETGDMAQFAALSRWCHETLAEDERAFMETFVPTYELALPEGKLLCYHGSPRSYHDQITPTTGATELDTWLGSHDATIFVGGHTHQQMLRRYRNALIINPGSIGLPFDALPPFEPVRNPAWAEYALIEAGAGGALDVRLCRAPYDGAAFVAAARASGMPSPDWYVADWVQ
ncbi:MAG TPA: metallophosphoesterase family protein [Ktedonobacterales bacterium]